MSTIDATTLAATRADVEQSVGIVWEKSFRHHANTKDHLAGLEGSEGSGAMIAVKDNLKNQAGERINFHASTDLGEFGKLGEERNQGSEEQQKFSAWHVIIDWKRHATGYNKAMVKKLQGGEGLRANSSKILGRHFGQWKNRDSYRNWIDKAQPGNTIYPNGKESIEALRSDDIFSTTFLNTLSTQAEFYGVEPASMDPARKYGLGDVYKYILLAENRALKPVKTSPAYLAAVQHGDMRGKGNNIFSGGYMEWDGNCMLPIRGVVGDQDGPIGTALAPVARMQQDLTLEGGDDLQVSTNNDPLYFIDFPGFAYRHTESVTPPADGSTYHLLVINPDHSLCVISYVGSANYGNFITATAVLGDATAVGNVDGTAAPWSDFTTTNVLKEGALIYPCNSYGVPYAYSLFLGANSAFRAYGQDVQYNEQHDDYNFRTGVNYEALYGDNVATDRNGRVRNFILAPHAFNPTGITLPEV